MSEVHLKPWRLISSRPVYSAQPWVRVDLQAVQLPDGRLIDDYHYIQLQEHCVIYAETTDGSVIVERQYKHGAGSIGLSLPAGALASGEDPLSAAARELLEETGYSADHWEKIGEFAAHGNYGCGRAHLFRARNAMWVASPNSGDLEEIQVLLMAKRELLSAVRRGEVHLMGSALAITLVGSGEQ
jgi:ADP-ribose pyrophosphatase